MFNLLPDEHQSYNDNILHLEDLYIRDSKGKIRVFKSQVEDLGDKSYYQRSSGVLNGKLVSRTTEVRKGKNVGKANETTHSQQATLDLRSKWEAKRRDGYKTLGDLDIEIKSGDRVALSGNIYIYEGNPYTDLYKLLDKIMPEYNTDKEGKLKPMKAQPFFKTRANGDKYTSMIFPCYAQPKLNGVRAFLSWEICEFCEGQGMGVASHTMNVPKIECPECKNKKGKAVIYSKKGLNYNLPHITDGLTIDYFFSAEIGELVTYDGELYIHNTVLSAIYSAVVKYNFNTPSIQFHLYDLAIPDFNQKVRLSLINKLFSAKDEVLDKANIVKVKTFNIKDIKSALAFRDYCINNGYEGAMMRSKKARYSFGRRVVGLLKLKKSESAEFTILDVIDSDKNPGIAIFICRNNVNLETFKVNPEGTEEQKRKWLQERSSIIGKLATVEFMERTKAPKELPFHAKLVSIRDYE